MITIHDLTYKRFPELLQKETLENLEPADDARDRDRPTRSSASRSRRDAICCASTLSIPSRAVAIHSGLGAPATAEPFDGLPARYILFVSTIEPRKNLGTLIDAYERLRDAARTTARWSWSARIGWKSESLVPRLRGRGHRASRLPPAPRNWRRSTRTRRSFVFPSIYEGFGFPLLEAMARGVPSIAARSSSLPEIGGDAALYFEPSDVDALAAQLERVLSDARAARRAGARGRARRRSSGGTTRRRDAGGVASRRET